MEWNNKLMNKWMYRFKWDYLSSVFTHRAQMRENGPELIQKRVEIDKSLTF